ncbi:MAG: hypothetical protein ACKO6B_11340, partial [Planctomycetia bacterium]
AGGRRKLPTITGQRLERQPQKFEILTQRRPAVRVDERRIYLFCLGRFEGPQQVADKIFSHGKYSHHS